MRISSCTHRRLANKRDIFLPDLAAVPVDTTFFKCILVRLGNDSSDLLDIGRSFGYRVLTADVVQVRLCPRLSSESRQMKR